MNLQSSNSEPDQIGDASKFVLMVQPQGRQGLIWQSVLRSQHLSVLWESVDVDLIGSLSHLTASNIALPDLVLLDTQIQKLSPYGFCRWSRRAYPGLKVALVNTEQVAITPSEQAWARYQGASLLLPRFEPERLVTGGLTHVRRILELLDMPKLEHGALVAALLQFSREAEPSRNGTTPAPEPLVRQGVARRY